MLDGPLVPAFISYAIPLVLASLLQLVYNAADIAVLGNLADADAVASVGATTVMISFAVNTFTSIVTGVNILAARAFGAKDEERIARLVKTTYTFSLVLGIFIAVLGQILTLPLLKMTGCPENIIDGAELYMRIYFIGAPASTFYNFMASIIRTSGDSRRPFIYLAISGATNVILNIVLVLTTGMAVMSVGVATVASMYVSAILLFVHMVRSKGPERLKPFNLGITADIMMKIIRYGIPAAVSSICFSLANVQIQSAINAYGEVGISGNTASISVEGVMFSVSNNASIVVSAFVGQSLGVGNRDKTLEIIKKSYIFWIITGLIDMAICLPLAKSLLNLIIPGEPEAIAFGAYRLYMLCACAVIHCLMNVNAGMLQAFGKTTYQMMINLIGICGFRLLWMTVVYPLNKTPFMLYIAYPISFTLVCIVGGITSFIMVRKFKRGESFGL